MLTQDFATPKVRRDTVRCAASGPRESPPQSKRPVALKIRKFATVSFRSYRGAFFCFMK